MINDPRLPRRFWDKVTVVDGSGCWLWSAALDGKGYGHLNVGSRRDGTRRMAGAHRVAYEALVASVGPGLELDHLCRVRRCVNPAHLEPVTRQINVLRGESPAAEHARKTHCPAGHAYDAENTYTSRRGRHCRICNRAAVAKYAARRGER